MMRLLAESLQQTAWTWRGSTRPEFSPETQKHLVRALAMLLLQAVDTAVPREGGADEREANG